MIGNILGLSLLSGILYRLGGIGKPFRSWMRDWLIPGVVIVVMIFILKIQAPWWAYLISYPLMGGALCTYWDDSDDPFKDSFSRIINWMYPEDNFYLHGFIIGLGLFPIAIVGSLGWIPLLIRAVVLGFLMGGLNWLVHKLNIPFGDWIEELSRGAFIIVTLILL